MNDSMNERLLPTYLTEPQMTRMRNMAKEKESRTPRIICSSLVSRLSTGQRERTVRRFSTLRKQTHTCECSYLPF